MNALELAATFESRRTSRTDLEALVKENMAELAKAGLPAAGADEGECVLLVRTIAAGCGATAFSLAAACADEGRADGSLCDAAAFLGLAERAYRLAVEAVTDRPGAARLPGPQFAVARIRGELATMTALLDRSLLTPNTPASEPRVFEARGSEVSASGAHAEIAGESGAPGDPRGSASGSGGSDGGRGEPGLGGGVRMGVGESGRSAAAPVVRYYLGASAEQVVSAAVDLVGGADQRIGQVWQDLKHGPVLPFDRYLALEVIGKTALGIDTAETPRWL